MFKTNRAVVRISAFAFAAFSALSASAADVPRNVWQDAPSSALSADMPQPGQRRSLTLDFHKTNSLVAGSQRAGAAVALSLPHPDGGFYDFLLSDSGVMPAELQAKYPEIVSLSGIDGEGRSARVDISPSGLQAMVFDTDGVWIVRPEMREGTGNRYMSYRRADVAMPTEKFQCETHEDALQASRPSLLGDGRPASTLVSTGANTRNYRAAVAANHNYVAAVCPGNLTVACGLGQVVLAMNRVNQVYETELGVHLTLIADNDKIIYPLASGNPAPTTPTNDPYSNNTAALGQNQTNLTNVIGTANFDIGHVFTTGSGGVAGLAVTCLNSQKGRGTTGLSNPVGDDFYIDYVSHEMGHQFGGNHTFNSTTSSCGGGNRAANAAYEPGSGSTIQAYAGICAADNLQPHSDPYFHAKSLDEINTWINGNGGSCVSATPATNAAPVIDPASLPTGLTIPHRTPFALSAVATDADGDILTYNWEQYDLGSATALTEGDIGNGPIFRSYNATLSPIRIFPSMSAVLEGGVTLPKGEAWPNSNRNLNFRLTVRDNHDVPGTPQFGRTESANITLAVTTSAGPFVVTSPNTATTWDRADPQTVTWNVANTDAAPVSCANVRLDLSVDGGASWPFELAASTANNGSASVMVPAPAPNTTQARVRASCVGNVFFDVSNANFTIVGVEAAPVVAVDTVGLSLDVVLGQESSGTFEIGNDGGGTLTWQITEAAAVARGTGGCENPTDIDWLSVSPTSGTANAVAPSTVTVTVSPTMLSEGEHSALLCVSSNDEENPLVEIPVTITVELPPLIFANGFE